MVPPPDDESPADSGDTDVADYVDSNDGFLSTTDREYLLGMKTYSIQQSENNRRQDIRNRTLAALLDFNLIANQLSSHDRGLIFQQIMEESREETLEDVRGTTNWAKETRHTWFGGLVETIRFFYTGLAETQAFLESETEPTLPFEYAVFLAENERNPFEVKDVTLEIDRVSEDDITDALEKLETDSDLTVSEARTLLYLLLEDIDRFTDQIAAIDIDFDLDLPEDETLTRGESLIVIGHMHRNPDRFAETDLLAVLHEQIIQGLNLDLLIPYEAPEPILEEFGVETDQ